MLLTAATVATASAAAPIPARDLTMRADGPAYRFRWRAAPEVAAQPSLLLDLRAAATRSLARLRAEAIADRARAKRVGQGVPTYRLFATTDWKLAADTPKLLSLIGESSSYSGGAHGSTSYAMRLWDKSAKRPIAMPALFANWPKARKAIEADYCKALAQAQAQRRIGEKVSGFDACPRLSDQVMVPWGGFDDAAPSIIILLPPYTAGPYSEGSYEITVAWPASIKPLLKPAWRSTFFPSD